MSHLEIWKDIKNYEGDYKISNFGNVLSLKHNKKRILKACINRGGYSQVVLTKNKKSKSLEVHRMVAMAFIPNLNDKPCVNHINGIKTDNKVENLEWVTYLENMHHAIKNKLINNAEENSGRSKLKKTDIIEIFLMRFVRKLPNRTIANILKVGEDHISDIIMGKAWKSVKQKYFNL